MADRKFDIVVIGAGPGGYVAAIRAAQLGMSVAVVERAHLGGICLNWGCIPTKALLRSAEVYRLIGHADAFGLSVKQLAYDTRKVIERSRKVAQQLSAGVKHLLRKNKVIVIDGTARLDGVSGDLRKVAVKETGGTPIGLLAGNVIIATGARARQLPGLETDGKLVWSYREAMVPDAIPKSLLVIGSGAIGMEFASFYRTLGAEVTVVEVMDRILPVEDEEISALARKSFEKQGVKILVSASVTALEKSGDGVKAKIDQSGKRSELTVERVISAVGIVGNVEEIGLEGTAIRVERSHIVTDAWGATAEKGVWAIGDVAGPPWLAHKASHEGILVVEKIAGLQHLHPIDASKIPGCTYCHPQIASVGLTEKAARDKGYDIKVGKFPFIGNGKAIALGETEGLVKTVFDARTGELLGAHMIGSEVTELIQGYGIARSLEATEADLMHTVFPHPTLSEAMHEAVLAAYGRVLHF